MLFNKTRQEFKTFSATLYLDNICTETDVHYENMPIQIHTKKFHLQKLKISR